MSIDELAVGLASGTVSRGRALKLLGSALIGGLLASFPGVAGAAKCVPLGHKCVANIDCCARYCDKRGKVCTCPDGTTVCNKTCVPQCTAPQVLNSTTCQCECPLNQVVCNGACVSNQCGNNQVFNSTTCQCECMTNTVMCNGACVSNACGAGQQFNATTCQCEAAPSTCSGQAEPCLTPGVTPYSLNGECCCRHYAGGGFACFECNALCFPPCNSDSDCPSGASCSSENPPVGFAGYCIARCGVDPVSVCI
jgi:Cys-rich repeat protein